MLPKSDRQDLTTKTHQETFKRTNPKIGDADRGSAPAKLESGSTFLPTKPPKECNLKPKSIALTTPYLAVTDGTNSQKIFFFPAEYTL